MKGKPLMDCSREEILLMMVSVMKFVGIRPENFPDKFTKNMLITSIQAHNGELTDEEFTLAFSIGVAGELNTSMNHFNSFDGPYINRIFSSYREYKRRVLSLDQPQTVAYHQRELSPKEIDELMINAVLEYFEHYKVGKHKHLKPDIFYSFLQGKGILTHSEEDQLRCENEAREMLIEHKTLASKQTLSRLKSMTLINEIKALTGLEGETEALVENKAKVLLLHEFFTRLIDNEKELKEVL